MTTFSGSRAVLMLAWGLAAIVASRTALAEETSHPVLVPVSSSTLSGNVDTAVQWNVGPASTQIPEPGSLTLFALGSVAVYVGSRAVRKPL